ncbi:MAG: hypothetical protein A2786_00045 [Candidatus Chisholmbacteria bacterium RIFCSPHIGHO2_01_FULL_52_32]|uniref:Uncharacterized protein n=1 Tax=Candidatus Chisholmbacteria bacterium RIFCSPHIGHO2_01_FULL_52_32 TaxID=1797591 RepID=A0A1G1VQE2_9BACT|nr:MAG: hypothetical protein A2786_00045 [Candidatus Chisholmbacteria bacterium RIFCSPHIGHO2_01_FULL_52_32]
MAEFPTNISEYFSLGGSRTAQNAFESQGITIFSIISVIIKNLYVLVGIILLIMIFVGGLGMILNAGNPEAAKSSNKTMTSAVMGFAILIAAYWLVKIVQIIFGIEILNPAGGAP